MILQKKLWLNQVLERWARWVQNGKVLPKGFHSIFGVIAQYKDGWRPSERQAITPISIELDIERCLMRLHQAHPVWVQVIRAEYCSQAGCKNCLTQKEKAHQLGLSLRTYSKYLSLGRKTLYQSLHEKSLEHS